MTAFEYRDVHGDVFQVRPTVTSDGPRVALETNLSIPVFVPLDRVEEVVAGIRDAARQATAQPAADEVTFPACGSRSLPISTGEVVRCVLVTGHAGQCQSAAEYPYVSWPNPSNGVWNPAAGPAAPTNHDTETEARDTDVTWSVVFITDSGDAWQEWSKGWHRIEDALVSGENVAGIATVAEVRFVRTTTVRERFNLHQLAAGAES